MLKFITSALKADSGGFSAIISTPRVDKDGESVLPTGLVNRDEYLANPLIYWAHEWAYNPTAEPIGKATRLEVFGDRIESAGIYAPTLKAQNVRALVNGGFVNQTSVGFDSLLMEYIKSIPTHVRWALREWSIVPMASNTGAVITGVKSALAWLAENFDPETLATERLSLDVIAPGVVAVADGAHIIGVAKQAGDILQGTQILGALAALIDQAGDPDLLLQHAAESVHSWLGAELAGDATAPDDTYTIADQQAIAPVALGRRVATITRA